MQIANDMSSIATAPVKRACDEMHGTPAGSSLPSKRAFPEACDARVGEQVKLCACRNGAFEPILVK